MNRKVHTWYRRVLLTVAFSIIAYAMIHGSVEHYHNIVLRLDTVKKLKQHVGCIADPAVRASFEKKIADYNRKIDSAADLEEEY